MIHDKDIVEDIFFRVKKILGAEFNGEIVLLLEKEKEKVRIDWAGTEPYIPKNTYKKKVKQELARGTPIHDLPMKTGISRRQIYRLLKQKN